MNAETPSSSGTKDDLFGPTVTCVRTRSIRGMFFVLAPATFAAAPLAALGQWLVYPWVVTGFVSAALFFSGKRHRTGTSGARWLATLAFLVWGGGKLVESANDPARGLAILLGTVGFLALVWPDERLRRFAQEREVRAPERSTLLVCAIAAFFGLDVWQSSVGHEVVRSVALSGTYLVPLAFTFWNHPSRLALHRAVMVLSGLAAAAPLVDAVLMMAGIHLGLTPIGLFSPLLTFAWVARLAILRWLAPQTVPADPSLLDTVLVHPSRVLVLSFVVVCVVGTVLLGLPISSSTGDELSWLNSAFTAVSATCVTGLVVVDTPTAFSGFGQVMVLLLIQVGGLGIMVFSAAAVVTLGRRLSLSHERAAVDLVGASSRAGLVRAVRLVLLVTFVSEAVASLLLFLGFLQCGDGVGTAAWRGLFTAISAFCNAGFALQTDSLVPYADNGYILSVVGATIALGGLGPGVVAAVLTWRERESRTLHVRLVLWTTAILVVMPGLLIVVLEWNGSLVGLTGWDKVLNAFFQSVTLRTAGFNSVDLTQIRSATWLLMVLLMFVGGSPGSTAGGIKTTTFAIVVLAAVAVVRGRERVEIFGRAVPNSVVLRSMAVATLGVFSFGVTLFAIMLTQAIPLDVATFEVVSALGTVGLSTGGTAALDEVGMVLIMACMFAGRVGPLTLFVFLNKAKSSSSHRFPEENIPIG